MRRMLRYARDGTFARVGPVSESVMPMVEAYRAGTIDWPALRTYLVNHDWSNPDANKPRQFDGAWYNDVEASIGLPPKPGTWAELNQAYNQGLLSREEFYEVSAAVDTKLAVKATATLN